MLYKLVYQGKGRDTDKVGIYRVHEGSKMTILFKVGKKIIDIADTVFLFITSL